MTGAHDWTLHIEETGLPALKQLYKLYGAEDHVMAKCFPQFEHNYNQVSREVMYNWFNKYLKLGQPEPVVEKPFEPVVPTKDLSVYDEQHPLPKDAVDAPRLRQLLTEESDKQIEALLPKDAKGLDEYRRVIGTALRVMIHDELPRSEDVEAKEVGDRQEQDGVISRRYLLSRKGAGEQVPAVGMCRANFNGTVVVWVHPAGKSSLFKDGKLVPDGGDDPRRRRRHLRGGRVRRGRSWRWTSRRPSMRNSPATPSAITSLCWPSASTTF